MPLKTSAKDSKIRICVTNRFWKKRREKMQEYAIRNAVIIDGTGKDRFNGTVCVKNGFIDRVTAEEPPEGMPAIDAKGHIVCPGFIDAHGHSDFTLFVNHRGESKVRQGITTEVTGNCGFTAGPINEKHYDDQVHYLANTIVLDEKLQKIWHFKSQDEFLKWSARDGLSFNIVPLVGLGMIHVGVMGFESRTPDEAELQKMKDMLCAELDAGFFGMSAAFEYEPCNTLDREEVYELCRVLKDRNRIFTIHMKNEGMNLIENVKDAIEIARNSGCRVEISHLKSRFIPNWGRVKDALKLIDEARSEGLDVCFDVYPYTAYGAGLIDLVPPWAKKDGPRIMCARLQDPDLKAKALYDMEHGLEDWDSIMKSPGWGKLVSIASLKTAPNKRFEGKTVSQMAEELGITDYEAVVKLMVDEDASVKCVWHAMCDDDLEAVMTHPGAIFGTDGRACATYGPLSSGAVHPRYYGNYPRIMGHYVREKKLMSLEEAIHKSTQMPAERFGIDRRGLLLPGYHADIVIFDPDTIREVSTFEKPHQYPEGIDRVIVNGRSVIINGEHTGELPGEILRV